MKLLSFLLIIISFVVTSCNPKVGAPGDVTVGPPPAVNAFLVSVANKYHKQGENLNIVLTHPAAVTVAGGTPKLVLDIGGSTVDASLTGGSGTNQLTFSYTVAMNDLDTNGIEINPTIDLNGATIKYTENAVEIDANTSLTLPNLSGVKVDAITPTISSVALPTSKTYYVNENIDFDVTFSENIVITGSPRMSVDVGGNIVHAQYQSGSGSNIIKFRKTVLDTEIDLGGISIASPLVLNSGTIKDVAGNNANLAFLPPEASGIIVNGVAPIVTSVIKPVNGTYLLGEDLEFTVQFNKVVNVTNFPTIALDIGGSIVPVTYVSGSGSTNLLFKYTIQSGDQDSNGLDLNTEITLTGGSIKDGSNNDARLTFSLVYLGAVFVQAVEPTITSVIAPANDMYETAEILEFTMNFSQAVSIVGTPRLALTVGSNTVYANYHSGSGSTAIKFRYTVQLGDTDNNGIEMVSPIDLDGGSIKSTYTIDAILTYSAPNTSGITINDYAPSILSITGPANNTYIENDNLDFIVTWSENVNITGTPRLTLDIGGVTKYATYQAGLSSSTVSIFRYTVVNPDSDGNGIGITASVDLNSGTIQDGDLNNANLTFTSPNLTGVLVESTPTTIISVIAPSNGSYNEADQLNFLVNFSNNVNVTGSPRIAVDVGGSTYYAVYTSGSGSTQLTFRYTVGAGHSDADGIATSSPVDLNGGTIKNAANNNAELTFTAPDTSLIFVDTTVPTITSVTAPADDTYTTSDVLTFTVNFSKIVTLTGSDAILNFKIGSQTRTALCLANTGLSTTCSYEIQTGEYDANGIEILSPFVLNTATAVDQVGNNLNVNFTPNTTPGVLVNSEETTAVEVLAPSNGIYGHNHSLQFSVRFSKVVTVTGSPLIELNIEGRNYELSYDSGSGSNILNFILLIPEGLEDLDGVNLASNINLNGGEILDINQFPPNMSLPTIDTSGVNVDSILPHITAIEPVIYQKIFNSGDIIQFRVQFNEIVTITGNPHIYLEMGHNLGQLIIPTGTAQEFMAEYEVQASDIDLDGINLITPLELNGASIIDAVNNEIQKLDFDLPDSQYNLISNPYIGLWLDANDQYFVFEDAGCTSRARPGLKLMCWLDKSINGYQLIQNDPARSPQLKTSNILPSRTNSVSFDGISSFLYQADAPTVGIVFLVFVSNNGAGSNDVMLWGEKLNNKAVQLSPRSNNTMILNSSHPDAPTPYQIAKVVMQNGSSTVNSGYVNITDRGFWSKSNAELAQITYKTNTTLQNQYMGSYDGVSNFLDGEIAEVIVLNDIETSPEIVDYIVKYLRMKYRMF